MIGVWLAIVTLAAQTADPPPWKAVKAVDGAFAAEMPAEARILDQDVESPPYLLRRSVYFCNSAGSSYRIVAITRPATIPESALRNALEADRKAYINAAGGKVLRDEPIEIDGRAARDFTLAETPPSAAGKTITTRIRLTLADRTSYIVSVASPPDGPLPENAVRFLDAFHLTGNAPRPKAPIADSTPEQALRAFLIAMLAHDEPTLRVVALPAAEFERLMGGQKLSAAQLIGARLAITTAPIRTLKPGDELTLPGGRALVIPPEDVADDRAVLLPEGNPVPTRLRRIDGHWKVDARPIISARKAAEAAAARGKAGPDGR